ncbi:hypothetical protein ABK040_006404 [Willaertia magna]
MIKPRGLFGGALTISIPERYLDASNFREIPNNQEVFTDNLEIQSTSSQSTGCPTLIVEILSLSENVNNENITTFMFEDLADSNHVLPNDRVVLTTFTDNHLNQVKGSSFTGGLIGIMKVEKNRAMDNVVVFVWVVRLPQYDTDILITLNDPTLTSNSLEDIVNSQSFALFKQMIQSFQILDSGLFA